MNQTNSPYQPEKQQNGAIVKILGLCKGFNGNKVLDHVNLTVNKGENIVVLGKSGAGKSTLIKCLIGLIPPDEGKIIVLDKNILELEYDELNNLRLKMGFLFQGAALYDSMTVKENLNFPLRHNHKEISREQADHLIMESLDQVGLKDAVNKMPAELSGGMTKRIGLARTLILQPEIMLYDEPTSGLDTATAKEISELILELQKKNNISSVIITHDMSCAKMTADKVVMLKEGSIVAEDSFESLANSEDKWIQSFFTK
jgi:phospholipid/cholesterol/gamma-HCH transport system ATP-binding protein